jgi:hypothetical protein
LWDDLGDRAVEPQDAIGTRRVALDHEDSVLAQSSLDDEPTSQEAPPAEDDAEVELAEVVGVLLDVGVDEIDVLVEAVARLGFALHRRAAKALEVDDAVLVTGVRAHEANE